MRGCFCYIEKEADPSNFSEKYKLAIFHINKIWQNLEKKDLLRTGIGIGVALEISNENDIVFRKH